MRGTKILAGLLVASVMSVPVMADDDPAERALEYRQGVYNAMAWSFGPMAAMVKGKMPYDAALFTLHAERVAFLSHLPLEGFIPDSRVGDTTAKQDVWDNADDFKLRMEEMISEAGKLATVSQSGDLDAIRPQFGALGKSCKGCHDEYRTE